MGTSCRCRNWLVMGTKTDGAVLIQGQISVPVSVTAWPHSSNQERDYLYLYKCRQVFLKKDSVIQILPPSTHISQEAIFL